MANTDASEQTAWQNENCCHGVRVLTGTAYAAVTKYTFLRGALRREKSIAESIKQLAPAGLQIPAGFDFHRRL